MTWPTSTPAIRTGEGMCSSVSVVNTALSTNGEPDHGVGPPNTRYTTATITSAAMMPAAKFEIRGRWRLTSCSAVVVSVFSPTLPDGLPIAAAAPEYGSFPAAHSAVSPGESVFGYGLTWSGPCSAVGTVTGVVYGWLDGFASPPRTSSIATSENRSEVPDVVLSESTLARLRRNSVT